MGKGTSTSGLTLLICSLLPLCLFAFVVSAKSAVRGGSNFDHWQWTVGRFVELWWLWTSLPAAGGLLTLASIRGRGNIRALSGAFLIALLFFSLWLGYVFWTQW
jgi:hypothetical protein